MIRPIFFETTLFGILRRPATAFCEFVSIDLSRVCQNATNGTIVAGWEGLKESIRLPMISFLAEGISSISAPYARKLAAQIHHQASLSGVDYTLVYPRDPEFHFRPRKTVKCGDHRSQATEFRFGMLTLIHQIA